MTLTVAVVALVTLTALTVIPGPKLAVVVPFTKAVNCPVTVTLSVCPCWPDAGVTDVSRGVPAMTLKPLTSARVLAAGRQRHGSQPGRREILRA